jgi:hypothetical protein
VLPAGQAVSALARERPARDEPSTLGAREPCADSQRSRRPGNPGARGVWHDRNRPFLSCVCQAADRLDVPGDSQQNGEGVTLLGAENLDADLTLAARSSFGLGAR